MPSRREFLAAIGGGISAGFAGCIGGPAQYNIGQVAEDADGKTLRINSLLGQSSVFYLTEEQQLSVRYPENGVVFVNYNGSNDIQSFNGGVKFADVGDLVTGYTARRALRLFDGGTTVSVGVPATASLDNVSFRWNRSDNRAAVWTAGEGALSQVRDPPRGTDPVISSFVIDAETNEAKVRGSFENAGGDGVVRAVVRLPTVAPPQLLLPSVDAGETYEWEVTASIPPFYDDSSTLTAVLDVGGETVSVTRNG